MKLTVAMDDMYDYGDWGPVDTCKSGSYGAGIQLKVHYMQSDVQLKFILKSHKWYSSTEDL